MSLSELRAELREHRKFHAPPVSRMKKGDVMMELERVRPAKVAEEVVAKKVVPKKVVAKEHVAEAKSIKHARK